MAVRASRLSGRSFQAGTKTSSLPSTPATPRRRRSTNLASYRAAYKKRRCLVVVSGFYEWDQITKLRKGEKKQPYYFTMADSPLMAFAGLWEHWHLEGHDPVTSCTVITTTPNELMAPLHDRLPVILTKDRWDIWLDPTADPEALKSLLVPIESDALRSWPVTKEMNTAAYKVGDKWIRNDKPEFINPIKLNKTSLF